MITNSSEDEVSEKLRNAVALHRQGRLDLAELVYKQVLSRDPDNFNALHMLGVVCLQRGDFDLSIALIGRAIAANPRDPSAFLNQGVALQQSHKFDDAIASYNRAISLKSDYVEAFHNRGRLWVQLERFEDALASYDEAAALNPNAAEIYRDRGHALHKLKKFHDAIASYDRSIALNSDQPEAYYGRGLAFHQLRRLEQALASYDKAIALGLGHAEVHRDRGHALEVFKRYAEALIAYEKALALDPNLEDLSDHIIFLKRRMCDWKDFDRDVVAIVRNIESGRSVWQPFAALFAIDSPAILKRHAERFCQVKYPKIDNFPSVDRARPRGRLRARDKIRIGYFSADFRNHPGAYSMIEMFEHHDRAKFEIFGFSFLSNVKYALKDRLEPAFDKFIEVDERDDLEVVRLSRAHEIDIAIDRNGFTTHCRPNIFAARAAPVQISYKAYPGTMGASYIDYLVADRVAVPESHQKYYCEKIIYLPGSYQVFDTRQASSELVLTRSDLSLPECAFVFACFNGVYKITPAVFDSWMRILAAVEGGVLWLLDDGPVSAGNLRREAVARGIDPRRLIFAPRLPAVEHLARHGAADLFLDTLPYNAHTTASDALWAGLPVLTQIGESFAGRVAAGILTAMELPELITHSVAEYESLAVALARDPKRLLSLKQKLRRHKSTAPFFDTALYTTHLERAYVAVQERYQNGMAPDHVFVDR
jgi:predicted O-linked N-acetylglucosamine transferase (SPINDLY family)